MTVAGVADILNLDPYVGSSGLTSFYSSTDVNAPLLTVLKAGPTEPYLAESWKWLDPGNKIQFTIRKGAGFHNGKPVTADDVLFSVEKVRAPYSLAGYAQLQRWIKDAQAMDERTTVFTLTETYALGWSTLGGLVTQPRHQPYEQMQKTPVGAGPYRVVEWRPFESLTMEASPYWWDANKVQVKTIVRLVVPEPESRLAMLRAGQIDLMDDVQPRQGQELLKDARFRVKVSDALTQASIVFSTDTPTILGTDIPNPFLDVRVRRAFIMALDRKAIFDGVALGRYGFDVPGPYSRGGMGANTLEDKITPYKYDPQAARRLLEEATFPFEREWPVWVYRTSAGLAEAAEAAVAQWNAAGIKARYRLTEVGTLVSYWGEQPSRTFPIQFIRSSVSNGEVSGYIWCTEALPECRLSQIGDTKLDNSAIKLRTAFEIAERQAIYEEIYRYLHEQAITIPLMGGVQIHALSNRIDWDNVPGQGNTPHMWRTRWMPGYP